jgi:pantothenate kinase
LAATCLLRTLPNAQQLCAGGGTSAAAAVVPMDGFHLYRRQLDALPDPGEAHARRGAPWTFDAAAFVECVRRVRGGGGVLAPSFDHGTGDPVADNIQVRHSSLGALGRVDQ